MSKHPVVVKTYGRHKYRTIKAQIWLSPDEPFLSPFGRDQSFPSKFEFDNLANTFQRNPSKWRNLSKKAQNSVVTSSSGQKEPSKPDDSSDFLDKENQCSHVGPPSDNVVVDRRPRRKRQNLFSNSTSLTQQQINDDAGFCNKNFDTGKSDIVLVNDSLENIQDIPSHTLQTRVHQQYPGHNLSDSGLNGQSLDANVLLQGFHSHPKEPQVIGNYSDKANGTPLTVETARFNSSCVTSTPAFTVNMVSAVPRTSCELKRSTNGKVVVEPLKITPIQGEKLASHSCEKSVNNPESPYYLARKSDSDQKSNKQKSWRKASGSDSSVELKECVVKLEKLRITPLKKRSRYCIMEGMGVADSSIGSVGKSHLSFVEALTPAKKNLPDWKSDDEEKVELSAFDKVLLECGQEGPVKFVNVLNSSLLKSCAKIGEGAYGEVFQVQYENGETVALKIIPVEGNFEVNGTPQKSFEEILPEIVISKELSLLGIVGEDEGIKDNLSNSFITVHSVTCCQDKYPEHLLIEWDRWDEEHNSENDRPEVFPNDQYFIVFEFSDGGKDLERFEFHTLLEAWSVLHQISLGLAVAENALDFEHRDLHWGNVLICRTEDEFCESCLLGDKRKVPTHGVHVSLIDFTLSRLTKDGLTVFCNLAEDESLFTGKGDYQFDVYRLMKKATQNDWEVFEPHTNALWLHYLADKMLKKKKYPSKDKDVEFNFRRFLRQAKKCSSATQIVSEFFE